MIVFLLRWVLVRRGSRKHDIAELRPKPIPSDEKTVTVGDFFSGMGSLVLGTKTTQQKKLANFK